MHKHDHGKNEKQIDESDKAVCPIMDEPISKKEAAATNLTRNYRDHIYYLCCNTCARLWDKHPEKYANLQ